jgi:hypothetical protein
LGEDFALLTGCVRIKAPPGEMRLVIECPSKASRRLLYTGLRKHRGDIKCNISQSMMEYRNKQEVYRSAAHYKLQIIDRGDMMVIINPNKTGLLNENRIWLERTPE